MFPIFGTIDKPINRRTYKVRVLAHLFKKFRFTNFGGMIDF